MTANTNVYLPDTSSNSPAKTIYPTKINTPSSYTSAITTTGNNNNNSDSRINTSFNISNGMYSFWIIPLVIFNMIQLFRHWTFIPAHGHFRPHFGSVRMSKCRWLTKAQSKLRCRKMAGRTVEKGAEEESSFAAVYREWRRTKRRDRDRSKCGQKAKKRSRVK